MYIYIGNTLPNDYYAVFCSLTKGVLGTLYQYKNTFGTWIPLGLSASTCRYVGFTPYTPIVGAPADPNAYCPHTAILVNYRVPCAPTVLAAVSTTTLTTTIRKR